MRQKWAGPLDLCPSQDLSPLYWGAGGASMNLTPEARTRDIQTRHIQDAVTNVEKHFGDLCQIFAAYVRKTARLRDKADLLVKEVHAFADTETPSLKHGLKKFADELAKLQDYRQAEVERLEAKIVEPLKSYGAIIRLKREDLKVTLSAKNREAKQLAQLERTRQRNPMNRQIIAESELQRATMDASRISRQLEETIDNFEKQKIKDIKGLVVLDESSEKGLHGLSKRSSITLSHHIGKFSVLDRHTIAYAGSFASCVSLSLRCISRKIFSEFVTIEMLFHGKALEVYTAAYQNIQNIEEEEDLQVFRSSLHPQEYQSRLDVVRANSRLSFESTCATTNRSEVPLQCQRKNVEHCDNYGGDEDDGDEDDATDDED